MFTFRPDALDIGAVRHYVKSNLDGSNASRVTMYVASATRIEVVKIEVGSDVLAYVVAELDWARASAVELHSWHILPKSADPRAAPPGLLRAQAVLWLDAQARQYRATLPFGQGHAPIGDLPVHLYNFDLMSLNATLPCWREPETALAFQVIDPDFNAQPGGNMLLSRGAATLRYTGRERYSGIDCRAYALGGEGMADQTGRLWTDATSGYVVAIEHPLPDNPSWNSFKLALQSMEHMDRGAWLRHVAHART